VSYPKDELAPPDAATHDPLAFELARLWLADGAPHVALRTGVWPDPAAWGVVLVDLARYIALAYHQSSDIALGEAFERILYGLRAELEPPSARGDD
jgi:hypothetical protein